MMPTLLPTLLRGLLAWVGVSFVLGALWMGAVQIGRMRSARRRLLTHQLAARGAGKTTPPAGRGSRGRVTVEPPHGVQTASISNLHLQQGDRQDAAGH